MNAPRYAVYLVIAALTLLALACTNGCGKKEFEITKTKIVTEVDDDIRPVGEDLSGGSVKANEKAVYLWFEYRGVPKAMNVKWEITRTEKDGNKEEYGDQFELKKGSSRAYFGIELNPGETLPPGDYELVLKDPTGQPLLKDPSDPKKPGPVKFTVK